jgi:hypothetical protein
MVIIDLDGVALDGNALFPLKVHIVQHLVHHLTLTDSVGNLQKSVCQGTFSVVYMGDYAKISDILHSAP